MLQTPATCTINCSARASSIQWSSLSYQGPEGAGTPAISWVESWQNSRKRLIRKPSAYELALAHNVKLCARLKSREQEAAGVGSS